MELACPIYVRVITKTFPQDGGMFWGKGISNNNWPYMYTYPYCPNRRFRPEYNNQTDWSNPRPMFRAMDMVHRRFCLMRWDCRMHRQHNGNFGLAHKNCPHIRRLLRIRYTNRMTASLPQMVCMFPMCICQYQYHRRRRLRMFHQGIVNLTCMTHHGCLHQNIRKFCQGLEYNQYHRCLLHWRCWALWLVSQISRCVI